ncbi:MAG: polyketide cyclase [SAR202 cluster bacterium]|nr:polyketide cyclase [SAR202 cluster bacterium]
MAANDYNFLTTWRVQGTCEEVYEVLKDAPDLVRWWPAVYLDVKEEAAGDAEGVGKVVSLHTKGWLPYRLKWKFRVTRVTRPSGFALSAWGDFVGEGVWTFTQDGDWVKVQYDWRIRADKPLLQRFSFIMKPVFAGNHRWAMARGEESLKLELARRHARSLEERAAVAPPPGQRKGRR